MWLCGNYYSIDYGNKNIIPIIFDLARYAGKLWDGILSSESHNDGNNRITANLGGICFGAVTISFFFPAT